ncbi:MAG: hypothetical protein PHT84_03485 [Candidatus Pacebacteria bacterium]|nr:hypothetical protein [Candidatus Paceibacterota bacterium]
MYLTDYDGKESCGFQNKNYVPDHVLFREINSEILPVLEGEKKHSANKIFRDVKGVHIAIRCNCGHNHPLYEKEGKLRAKWLISLCDKTVNFLIKEETVYKDEIGKRIWVLMD